MGIEKKVNKLAQRVADCERITEESRIASLRAVNAIDVFKDTVQELIEKTKLNSDAIVDHIAQLDTEKAEVIDEYRQELSQVHKLFIQEVEKLESTVKNVSSEVNCE